MSEQERNQLLSELKRLVAEHSPRLVAEAIMKLLEADAALGAEVSALSMEVMLERMAEAQQTRMLELRAESVADKDLS